MGNRATEIHIASPSRYSLISEAMGSEPGENKQSNISWPENDFCLILIRREYMTHIKGWW